MMHIRPMSTMAAKSKCFGIFSYSFCISALFLACVTYIYIDRVLEINGCLNNEDDWKWREYINWFSFTDENHCNLWLWKTHQNAISKTFQHFDFTQKETYLSILFGALVISILALLSYRFCRKEEPIPNIPGSPEIRVWDDHGQIVKNTSFDIRKFVLILFFVSVAVSVPWEFVRLYQREVSKRAASFSLGAPKECSERSTSLFQSLTLLLQWQFSWSHLNKCETYYYHLLVDPLWELTPLLVISSALTRCLLHPIELLFSGMGRSFRAFFVEIPAQWQPVLLVILTFILLALMLMKCSYRLHIPLLFKIEPRTPVYIQDCSHRNTNQNKAFLTNGNGSYISTPNQYSSYIHSKALTNGDGSYNSTPNHYSSYIHSRDLTNENGSYISTPNKNRPYSPRSNENRSNNMGFSLHDVPNEPYFKSSDTFRVEDGSKGSATNESSETNVTKKRKYTKKTKVNAETNSKKAGTSTPITRSTRARKSRKTCYEDDPDFEHDL